LLRHYCGVGWVESFGQAQDRLYDKTRTGIQDFQILQTGDPSFFVFKLFDTRTSLPQVDYNQVRLEMVIGDDAGSLELNLVERNGRWSLA